MFQPDKAPFGPPLGEELMFLCLCPVSFLCCLSLPFLSMYFFVIIKCRTLDRKLLKKKKDVHGPIILEFDILQAKLQISKILAKTTTHLFLFIIARILENSINLSIYWRVC